MTRLSEFLRRTATPFTAGLFIVSAVSGAALYFGVLPRIFYEMHEVLSMLLLVPFAVRLWRNWHSLIGYFRRAAMPIALTASVVVAAFFAFGAAGGPPRGGNPAFALMRAAQDAPLASLAPILQMDEATAVKRLSDAGFGSVSAKDTVAAIAARSGRDAFEVMAPLTAPSP
jgi:hypothetical protein